MSRAIPPDRWRQISQLWHQALVHAAPDRAAFLQEACAGDETLRQEVESLLANESRVAGFLSEPGLNAATVMSDEPGASMVGRQIGTYRILSLLGAGGMGEVYRAHDLTLERDVAIKIPKIFTADAGRLARFAREARLLASLNHPYIATIHGLHWKPRTRRASFIAI
jgi:serine/threonine protein kinase